MRVLYKLSKDKGWLKINKFGLKSEVTKFLIKFVSVVHHVCFLLIVTEIHTCSVINMIISLNTVIQNTTLTCFFTRPCCLLCPNIIATPRIQSLYMHWIELISQTDYCKKCITLSHPGLYVKSTVKCYNDKGVTATVYTVIMLLCNLYVGRCTYVSS